MNKLILMILCLASVRTFATPLTDAVNIGDRAAVDTLLANGADPDQADSSGDGPLFQAISAGQNEIAGDLILAGAALDVLQGEKKENLLFETVRLGENGILRKLLHRRRSLVNGTNTDGETALFMAVRSSQTLSAQLLLRAGARKDVVNKAGQTPADLIDPSDTKLQKLFGKEIPNTPPTGQKGA